MNKILKSWRLGFICLCLSLCGNIAVNAQKTAISGKVTDSETGDGMPFVNVFFKGTAIGTTTDFEGKYTIVTDKPTDSLMASYVGYFTKSRPVIKGKEQSIQFQMIPDAVSLQAVDIVYGDYENPAWEIMRAFIKNKPLNDKRSLDAYQYESYSKVELDVDNITDKFKEKKMVRKILSVMDSIKQIAGEDGKSILPIFVSETVSDYYFASNPDREREIVRKTKLTGIALENGSLTSQVIGSSFQIYNFYQNWIDINGLDFISPLADSWRAFYDYELLAEGEMVGGYPCYRIKFSPKRPEDLAFSGTLWIADSVFALKQLDLRVGKEANLNFIEKIQVQQELEPSYPGGPWLPSKSRILLDIGEVKDDWAGMLAKFYVSNKKFVVNQPKENKFFDERVSVADDAMMSDKKYWEDNRHDTLSSTEQFVYQMIDTMRNLPSIKTYVEIFDIAFNGYKTVGKFAIGPYIYLLNKNNVEGLRFHLGFKTNYLFSKKWIFKGYLAYGLKDTKLKHNLEIKYIASRKHWTLLGLRHYKDIGRMGLVTDNSESTSAALIAASRSGTLRRPFWNQISELWMQTDVIRGWTQRVSLRSRQFTPIETDYDFYYLLPSDKSVYKRDFKVSELVLETRIAFKERWLQYDNDRTSLGTDGRPILTLKAVLGFKNVLNSDFSYQKFDASIAQDIRVGLLGRVNYTLGVGYVPSQAPYPVLETHLGAQSFFYNSLAFNMMQRFEFVSDHYAYIRIKHDHDGMLLNRIPLMRKLKWRSFFTGNVLVGGVRQANIDIIPQTDASGNPLSPYPAFYSLSPSKPYMELGYGIENIFRFLRVDFIHRISYLQRGAKSFGIKFSTQFSF